MRVTWRASRGVTDAAGSGENVAQDPPSAALPALTPDFSRCGTRSGQPPTNFKCPSGRDGHRGPSAMS